MVQWELTEYRRLAPEVAHDRHSAGQPIIGLEAAMASAAILTAPAPPGDTGDHVDDLVRRVRSGDESAFGAIYERYSPELYWHALRLTGDADDAGDMTQEAFARAIVALPRTTGPMNLRAWLYRIVTNASYDLLRQRARLAGTRAAPEQAAAMPDHDPETDPETCLMRHEARAEVARAFEQMHDRARILLLLRERDELSCAEIGERIGTSRTAVKSGLFRARHEFRRIYDANRNVA